MHLIALLFGFPINLAIIPTVLNKLYFMIINVCNVKISKTCKLVETIGLN